MFEPGTGKYFYVHTRTAGSNREDAVTVSEAIMKSDYLIAAKIDDRIDFVSVWKIPTSALWEYYKAHKMKDGRCHIPRKFIESHPDAENLFLSFLDAEEVLGLRDHLPEEWDH